MPCEIAEPGPDLQEAGRDPRGLTVWLTGLSSAGKSTIARALRHRLAKQGLRIEWLDGDDVRQTLSCGLGFSRKDRNENVMRMVFVAEILTRNGIVTIVSAASPARESRERARRIIGRFLEVFVDAPLPVCEQRDGHGIYARARRGEISHVAGLDIPYEPPFRPDVHCKTALEPLEVCVERVVQAIGKYGEGDS